MTGRLALDLSAERITLLGADGDGWFRLADVRFGSAQFTEGVERLLDVTRNLQGVLTPGAESAVPPVLLVLPESQVQWERLDDISQVYARRHTGLRRDISEDPEGVALASVPLQTLEEAESFVRSLGFRPVGAIAPGPEGSGFATAWFGAHGDPTEEAIAASRPWPPVTLDRRRIGAHPPARLATAITEEAARRRARDAARLDPAHLRPLDEDEAPVPPRPGLLARLLGRGRPVPVRPQPPRRAGKRAALLTLALIGAVATAAFLALPGGHRDEISGADVDVPMAVPEPQPATDVATAETAERPAPVETATDTEVAPAAPETDTAALPQPAPDAPSGPVIGFYTPAPGLGQPAAQRELPAEILDQPGLDPDLGADALALPMVSLPLPADRPAPLAPPPEAGLRFAVDARGLVLPTAQGALSPEGHLVIAGRPGSLPARRPELPPVAEADLPPPPVTDRAALAADDPLRRLSPRQRPDGLAERFERAQLGGRTLEELAVVRPASRPESLQEQQAAPAPPTANAIAAGPRPPQRPSDLLARAAESAQKAATQAVAAASTAAVTQPRAAEPRVVVAPRQQTASAPAPKAATDPNQIDLSQVNLLGTFGRGNALRALVRMPGGDILNVSVGDRMDGGKVQAIGSGQLVYVKRGRPVTLRMP